MLGRKHTKEARKNISINSYNKKLKGKDSPYWKGDNVAYITFHARVWKAKGKADFCEVCGLSDKRRRYNWANLTGKYNNINDYKKMCVPCHSVYDRKRRTKNVPR